MFKWLKQLFSVKDEHYLLYGKAVGQARQPLYYTDMMVQDTVDGRFDMIILQLFLITNRLSTGDDAKEVNVEAMVRGMQEALVADMDRSLREMGVGDMAVGKQVKRMAVAWLGRAKAYGDALEDDDLKALPASLALNLYNEADEAPVERMAAHIRALHAWLATVSTDDILNNSFDYPTLDMSKDNLIAS